MKSGRTWVCEEDGRVGLCVPVCEALRVGGCIGGVFRAVLVEEFGANHIRVYEMAGVGDTDGR